MPNPCLSTSHPAEEVGVGEEEPPEARDKVHKVTKAIIKVTTKVMVILVPMANEKAIGIWFTEERKKIINYMQHFKIVPSCFLLLPEFQNSKPIKKTKFYKTKRTIYNWNIV